MASRNLKYAVEAYDSTRQYLPKVLAGDLNKAGLVLHELDIDNNIKKVARSARDSVWGTVTSDSGRIAAVPFEQRDNGLVPDVRGMGAQDALYLLEKCGLKVDIVGVGRVRSQSLKQNTRFRKGDRIQITLSM